MTGSPSTARRGPWLRLLLRAAAAGLLLWLAFRWALPPESRELATLREAWVLPLPRALAWLAAAVALFGLNFAVGALRFQLLLRGAGLPAHLAPLLRAYVVASFFNLLLPTGLPGDAFRLTAARRDLGRGAELLGVLALERLLSLAALAALVLGALPQLPGLEPPALRAALGIVGASLLVGTLLLAHRPTVAWLRRSATWPLARWPRLEGVVGRSLGAVAALSERGATLAAAFALSVLMQAILVACVFLLARPLDASVSLWGHALVVPITALATLLPLTLGGIGIREHLYLALYGSLGMRAPVALSLSLATFAMILVWSLVGLALFVAAGRARAAPQRAPGPLAPRSGGQAQARPGSRVS